MNQDLTCLRMYAFCFVLFSDLLGKWKQFSIIRLSTFQKRLPSLWRDAVIVKETGQPQGALITCTQSSVSFQEEELWDDKGRNRKTTILSNFSHIGDYHNQWYALVSTLTLRNKSLAIKYALVQHTFTAFKPPDDAYSI